MAEQRRVEIDGVPYVPARAHVSAQAIENAVRSLYDPERHFRAAPPRDLRVIISGEDDDIEGEEGVSIPEFTAMLLEAASRA